MSRFTISDLKVRTQLNNEKMKYLFAGVATIQTDLTHDGLPEVRHW
jgi:hypothetical protein